MFAGNNSTKLHGADHDSGTPAFPAQQSTSRIMARLNTHSTKKPSHTASHIGNELDCGRNTSSVVDSFLSLPSIFTRRRSNKTTTHVSLSETLPTSHQKSSRKQSLHMRPHNGSDSGSNESSSAQSSRSSATGNSTSPTSTAESFQAFFPTQISSRTKLPTQAHSKSVDVFGNWRTSPARALVEKQVSSRLAFQSTTQSQRLASHKDACECGGLDMVAFRDAMIRDAQKQEGLVPAILEAITGTVEHNRKAGKDASTTASLSKFCGLTAIPCSMERYLSRIFKYAEVAPCCLVVAFMYLERIKNKNPSLRMDPYSVQRLLLLSVMLSAKFLDDFYYSNKQYSLIADIANSEVNELEIAMLNLLDFNLAFSREEYDAFVEKIPEWTKLGYVLFLV